MLPSDLSNLLGLAAVAAVALLAVWWLMQHSSPAAPTQEALTAGYPPSRFPDHNLTTAGPLAELAVIQSRLLSVYQELPAQSDMAVWLRALLIELREVMDTAYRVAVITRVYGRNVQIEPIVAEVRIIEEQAVAQITQRLLNRDADAQAESLTARLATLRLCLQQLTA